MEHNFKQKIKDFVSVVPGIKPNIIDHILEGNDSNFEDWEKEFNNLNANTPSITEEQSSKLLSKATLKHFIKFLRKEEKAISSISSNNSIDEMYNRIINMFQQVLKKTKTDEETEIIINTILQTAKLISKISIKAFPKRLLDKLSQVPEVLPQPTFKEARNMGIAIADGKSGRNWHESQDEIALIHAIPNERIQVKLAGKPNLSNNSKIEIEALWSKIQQFEPRAILLLNIAIAWGLKEQRVTTKIDNLVKLVGLVPRSIKQKEQMRQTIWSWMVSFDQMMVVGKRSGYYIDKRTKQPLDLSVSDSLIKVVTRYEFHGKPHLSLLHEIPPEKITFVVGDFLNTFRKNKQVLQFFSNVRKLTSIPTGKPSGAWAQSIGLALNQLWREQSRQADIYVSENNTLTACFNPFTRFQLLDLFRCEPWVEQILTSNTPNRAKKYWKEAIDALKRTGIISYESAIDPEPKNRQGWQTYWLKEQRLDIRPATDVTEAVSELSQKAKTRNSLINNKTKL